MSRENDPSGGMRMLPAVEAYLGCIGLAAGLVDIAVGDTRGVIVLAVGGALTVDGLRRMTRDRESG